ncbi:hypothetical protein Tco_0205694, partial [Tanacetum coccineum]
EERVKKLEEYMSVIGRDLMQLSLEVIAKLKEKIRVKENRIGIIEKITRYPDTKDLELLRDYKSSETLTKKASPNATKFMPVNSLCVRIITMSSLRPVINKSVYPPSLLPSTTLFKSKASTHEIFTALAIPCENLSNR